MTVPIFYILVNIFYYQLHFNRLECLNLHSKWDWIYFHLFLVKCMFFKNELFLSFVFLLVGCRFLINFWSSYCIKVLITQPCPTLCNPWSVASQAPLSMGFQEYWSGLPFPSPGDLPNPGINQTWVSCIAGRFFTIWATREAICIVNTFSQIVIVF